MTTIVDELTLKARSLPAEDRARLAEDLLSSYKRMPIPLLKLTEAWLLAEPPR